MKEVVTLLTSRDEYSIKNTMKYSMTVGELIDKLREYDEDTKVVFSNDRGYTYGYVCNESFDIEEVKSDEEERMEEIEEKIEDLEYDKEQLAEERNIDLADIEANEDLSDEQYKLEKEAILEQYENDLKQIEGEIEELREEYNALAR